MSGCGSLFEVTYSFALRGRSCQSERRAVGASPRCQKLRTCLLFGLVAPSSPKFGDCVLCCLFYCFAVKVIQLWLLCVIKLRTKFFLFVCGCWGQRGHFETENQWRSAASTKQAVAFIYIQGGTAVDSELSTDRFQGSGWL